MKNITYLSVSLPDMSRPEGRPPKSTRKIEIIKKMMRVLQYFAPGKVAKVVWHYFTRPGKAHFTASQQQLIDHSEKNYMTYREDRIATYKWGSGRSSILICHGWRSKAADFHKMINYLLDKGLTVEAIDCRAHGHSEGAQASLPEYRDIIRSYIEQNGPFDNIIGYSMGGAAAGIAIAELPGYLKPSRFYLIAAPPYLRYFFQDIISDLGLRSTVYLRMADLFEKYYGQSIDYFDLRKKKNELSGIEKHFIYCEDDETIPFVKGMDLFEHYPHDHFVQAKGFGHYKIISHQAIFNYLGQTLQPSRKQEKSRSSYSVSK